MVKKWEKPRSINKITRKSWANSWKLLQVVECNMENIHSLTHVEGNLLITLLIRTFLEKVDKNNKRPVTQSCLISRYTLCNRFRNPDPVRENFSLSESRWHFRKIHIPSLVNGRKSSQNSATSIPTGSGFLRLDMYEREGISQNNKIIYH